MKITIFNPLSQHVNVITYNKINTSFGKMISNFCLKLKYDPVLIFLSLVLVWLNYTTTVISLGNQVVAMNKKCIGKERHVLLNFKTLLQDPDDSLSTWAIDDCCKWSGVICNNQSGHVIKLDLRNYLLEGEISPSFFNLTDLTHLYLSGNNFIGTIPDSIGSLTQLRYLDISLNSFNGTIPMSIGSLTELRYLDLSLNSFNGTIPMSIGSLTELRYLDLSFNLLYGTIPLEFGDLTNLQLLGLGNMGRCRVENLDWLSNLTRLQYLDMEGISLAKENHWVNIVSSLKNLTFLDLVGCNLSQVMHPYLPSSVDSSLSSSSIIDLYLGDNNLNSSISYWLFPLTGNRLKYLHLGGNKLDEIPKYLGNLCSLETLYLNENSALVNFSDLLHNLSGCTAATLQYLDSSRSKFTGSLSHDIQKFSSLSELHLDNNQLNGTISEKVWELPMLETLDVSSNSLRGAISENIIRSKIENINLSNNLLQGVTPKPRKPKSNFSYVRVCDLSSCNIGPQFPIWIHTLKNLTYLNIAGNGISDTIPTEFWNMRPSQLRYLNLSSNNISGIVPDLLSSLYSVSVIDLSSNNFYGPVHNVSSSLLSLNLSKNKFYGGISFLCQIVGEVLTYLDLSNNSFSGQLPDCLWHFQNLTVLNLGDNNLSGRLPPSIKYLIALDVLYLYNNNFSGELPFSLRNCSKLTFLDLRDNRFSGYVPVWIGEISGLYALSLSSNDFFGPIPVQLCQLVNVQILDLSTNNLNGTIPTCFNNLTAMVREGFLTTQNVHQYETYQSFGRGSVHWETIDYADHASIQWQGNMREFKSNLGLLKSLDLSSNHLTGQIPNELTDLHGLLALNLSKNALVGGIPQKIGQMKELLTLDLSGNYLSGWLPSNMSHMTSLDYLDVSYNSLSGRIPSSTQLQSFEPSRYTGNEALCGPPLTKHCPGDKELQVKPPIGVSQGDGEDRDELRRWFYIGRTIGFATGFWIVCSALLVNRRGRHTFFHFLDSLETWVYVKVMVFIAKFQRAAHS